MEGDQPVQSHSHAQQPLQPLTYVQEHCPGETGHPTSVSRSFWNVSNTIFKVLNYLSTVGLFGNDIFSIRKSLIECMPSFIAVAQLLLSDSLWTFQPTLVLFTKILSIRLPEVIRWKVILLSILYDRLPHSLFCCLLYISNFLECSKKIIKIMNCQNEKKNILTL